MQPPDGSGEEGRALAQQAEGLLQASYERNSLALVDLDTAVDSAVLGDGAFQLRGTQAGRPDDIGRRPGHPDLCAQCDNYRQLLMVAQTYAGNADCGGWACHRRLRRYGRRRRWRFGATATWSKACRTPTVSSPM